MKPVIFALPNNEELAKSIANKVQGEYGNVEFHVFPDGESKVKINTPVIDRDVIVVCNFSDTNEKILPLLFLAETAKELGAEKIILIAPYLAYMRQDAKFSEGEGVTSTYFAKLLSQYFTAVFAVEPHLHRYKALSEIYSIPAFAISVVANIAHWIRQHVKNPLLIGPDSGSGQWVGKVAELLAAPYLLLEKIRYGDNEIKTEAPVLDDYRAYQPVVIDDIISTGKTMIAAIQHLDRAKMQPAICIGVHAIFANKAHEELLASGIGKIITCNTISHITNDIDVSDALVEEIKKVITYN